MAAHNPLPLLVFTADGASAGRLAHALRAAGLDCTALSDAAEFLGQVGAAHTDCAPHHFVVIGDEAVLRPVLDAMAATWGSTPAGPVTLVGPMPPELEPPEETR